MPAAPLTWLADGRLGFDDVALADIAAGVDGQAVLAVSVGAVRARLESLATVGHALDVGAVGPTDVLRWAVEAGVALRARSRHELALALAAGARGDGIDVVDGALDDGLVMDALGAGVACVVCADDVERENVARVATHLGLPRPEARDARAAASHALTGCGVLLALVARAGDVLVVDALLPDAVGVVHALAAERDVDDAAPREVSVRGLAQWPQRDALPATCVGDVARGEWVAMTCASAAAPWGVHVAQPTPEVVLAQDGRWRFADPRALPVGRE